MKDERVKNLREKFSEALELPKELTMDLPKLTIIGGGDLLIENHKGIAEYARERIRVNSGIGIIKICGEILLIKEITSDELIISGRIRLLEFIKTG